MRDFPSCFGESGVQVADSSNSSVIVSKSSHNSVTLIYTCKLFDKSCLITIVWSKNLMGQCLSLEIDDESHNFVSKIDVKPSIFSKRKGFKSLHLDSGKIEVFWDLSRAQFGPGPEPLSSYYVAIVCRNEIVMLIGDLVEEASRKTGASASLCESILVTRREHVCGKRAFNTKARFNKGPIHDVRIECDSSNCNDDPVLVVRVDAKTVVKVDHLQWKFRGNCTVLIDGVLVEVFWDVHNWLFGPGFGNAVFMFRVGRSGPDSSSLFYSESLEESKLGGCGFCLVLYAWKNE